MVMIVAAPWSAAVGESDYGSQAVHLWMCTGMSMQIRSCSECGGVLTEAHSNNTHFIYMHFFEQHAAGIEL